MSDVNMIKTKVNQIRKIIKENEDLLKTEIDKEKLDELVKKDCSEFIEQYPTIYTKLKDNTLDQDKFEYMLDMLSNVNDKKVTEFDASVKIGQKLVDHYVKPKLEKK